MAKLPAWHRDAPAPKTKAKTKRPLWATSPGPDLILEDGTQIDFKTVPPGTYKGSLTTKGSNGILRMIARKMALMRGPQMVKPSQCEDPVHCLGCPHCMDYE